jgi:hypothetical protein
LERSTGAINPDQTIMARLLTPRKSAELKGKLCAAKAALSRNGFPAWNATPFNGSYVPLLDPNRISTIGGI